MTHVPEALLDTLCNAYDDMRSQRDDLRTERDTILRQLLEKKNADEPSISLWDPKTYDERMKRAVQLLHECRAIFANYTVCVTRGAGTEAMDSAARKIQQYLHTIGELT